MKIAVIFDSHSTGGGGFFISLNSALLLNKIKSEKFDFHFISIFEDTHKILEENNLKVLLFGYNKVKLSRLHFRTSGSPIINLIFGNKIKKTTEYFNTNCNDEKFNNNFKNILSKFEYLKSRWNE